MAKSLLQWRIYYHIIWVQLSTTCSNFTEVAQRVAPSCSQPQPATDNGVRDGRSNWLVASPTLHRAVPPELHVLHTAMRAGLQIARITVLQPGTCDLRSSRPTHCLCGHSGYRYISSSILLTRCFFDNNVIIEFSQHISAGRYYSYMKTLPMSHTNKEENINSVTIHSWPINLFCQLLYFLNSWL